MKYDFRTIREKNRHFYSYFFSKKSNIASNLKQLNKENIASIMQRKKYLTNLIELDTSEK